ncbi:MAG TPA: hypothetical protein VMJ35_04530 [Dongiaceae bacterium]|nr:hypothetical protein [Dongiaceae bacterium]
MVVSGSKLEGESLGSNWRPMAFATATLLLSVAGLGFGSVAVSPRVETTQFVPPGTVIPVRLDGTMDIRSLQALNTIEARVAQEVPLPNKEKLSLRSRILATVTAVKTTPEGAVDVSLRFDRLEEKEQTYPIVSSMRAIASFRAMRDAQMPLAGADAGTPAGWGTTVQIGGDQRFGDGGKVRNRYKRTVGKGVRGGVLVHLGPNPSRGCAGPEPGDDRLQATWVFSADACGVYDLKHVKIVQNGKSEPVGVITLEFAKDDMKLESGAAFLLRTVNKP